MKSTKLLPCAGLSREIGLCLSGMDEVRQQVVESVTDLSIDQFRLPAFAGAHSIGALVLHIGEAEWYWMQMVVQGQKLTDSIRQSAFWDVLEAPDAFAAKGYTAEFCLDEIQKIRQQTKEFLSSRCDSDLEGMHSRFKKGVSEEFSLRWILHHLIDHEAQHKGQILMLKRLLSS